MRWTALLWLAATSACVDGDVTVVSEGDGTSTGGAESVTGGPPPPPTPDPSTSTATSTTTDPEGGSSSSGPPPAECGNGVVEEGEDCEGDEDFCVDCLLPCRLDALAEVHGPPGTDIRLDAVDLAPDGSIIAAGQLGPEEGDSDVLLARIPEVGTKAVLDTYDLGGSDRTIDLVVDDSGGAYVLGGVSFSDARLLYVDADGEIVWNEATGDFADGVDFLGTGIAPLPGGGVVVAGTTDIGSGDTDIYVTGHDGAAFGWTSTFSAEHVAVASNDRGGPVALDDLGDIYVAGMTPSEDAGVTVSDPLVVKFAAAGGDPQWGVSKYLGATNLQLLAMDIVVDSAGRVHALYLQSHNSGNSMHFLLWSFEPDGQVRNEYDSYELGYMGGLQPNALVADDQGRVIVFSIRNGSSAGDNEGDTVVLGFDEDGELACEGSIPRPDDRFNVYGSAVRADDGSIVLVGTGFAEFDNVGATVARVRGFPG